MSANAPILILQMQRMGDLVLSYPLLGWLGASFPGHPLWVVGEPAFFNPLMPLSPQVTYFSYTGHPNFTNERFHAVINLSHRPETAELASAASSDLLVGQYLDNDGKLRIRGDWQIYRASLTHNNYYNLFHWADLNALDLISETQMRRTNWPLPGSNAATETPQQAARPKRIGLFLGASEPDKHPDAPFWADLAKVLIRAGHKPVLLGGEAEKPLGRQAAALLKANSLNLCGKFSVRALAEFIAGLDLFITPDTGPMHVAVWIGIPTLNISLGPVNPWETGPFSYGHHVVRPVLDCIGCWSCVRPTVECKANLVPGRIAAVAEALLGGGSLADLSRTAKGLEVLRSARNAYGLYDLKPLFEPQQDEALPTLPAEGKNNVEARLKASLALARDPLSRFWQAWYGELFSRFKVGSAAAAWKQVEERHPAVVEPFFQGLADLALALTRTVRSDAAFLLRNPDFWREIPGPLRPLSGYIHMYVQNQDADRASLMYAVSLVERLQALR
jgi:ADP-heptose:LPS heptosyltransferase